MATVPATIKAVTVQPDKSVKVTDVPRPKLNHQDEIIIQVHSCAQNPTDWKSVAQGRATAGNIVGNDLAGIVVEAGSDVTNVKVGDRVASLCMGAFIELGTGGFAEYARIPAKRAIRVPDSMSMNEAATIPLAGLTACSGLYQLLKLPEPGLSPSGTPILVWAGSTSVGMFVIQLAALSGLDVITTASPRNFDLLKSLGAKHVLDYNSPTVVEDISKLTQGRLEYIYDCHATDNSTQTAVKCLPGAGGKIATLLFIDESTLDRKVEVYVPLLYKISGKGFPFSGKMLPASEQDKIWSEEWCEKLSELLAEGRIKGNPVKVMGTLDAVADGFQYMQEGKVHAQKLVYEVRKE